MILYIMLKKNMERLRCYSTDVSSQGKENSGDILLSNAVFTVLVKMAYLLTETLHTISALDMTALNS